MHTNPLRMGREGLNLVVGHDTAGVEQVAARAIGASVLVFKTLNQTGAENISDATACHPKPMMFIAGDDADKKPAIMSLVSDLGFHPVDVGPLSPARLLEPLAML